MVKEHHAGLTSNAMRYRDSNHYDFNWSYPSQNLTGHTSLRARETDTKWVAPAVANTAEGYVKETRNE